MPSVKFRYSKDIAFAPRRGCPPNPPPGYEATHGDPYVFAKTQPDCKHRMKLRQKRPCCGTFTISFCGLKQQVTNRVKCNECELAEV